MRLVHLGEVLVQHQTDQPETRRWLQHVLGVLGPVEGTGSGQEAERDVEGQHKVAGHHRVADELEVVTLLRERLMARMRKYSQT